MAKPRASYASVPSNGEGTPVWDNVFGVLPVEYAEPCPFWPNLDWSGNICGDNTPTEYDKEHPRYLWSHPIVQNPVYGESHSFIRQWRIGKPGDGFDHQTIPGADFIFMINHAADDQYTCSLILDELTHGTVQIPFGSNSHIPTAGDSWRNVKSFMYHMDLSKVSPGTPVYLVSEVVNAPQIPHGVSASNPAMFTWTLSIFDH